MLRLEIDGADELVADMKKLVTDYPKAASDALFEVAENFNEDVNAKMPENYSKRIRKWKIQGAKKGTSSFVTSTNPGRHISIWLKMDMQNMTFMDIIQADLCRGNIMQSRPGRNIRASILKSCVKR